MSSPLEGNPEAYSKAVEEMLKEMRSGKKPEDLINPIPQSPPSEKESKAVLGESFIGRSDLNKLHPFLKSMDYPIATNIWSAAADDFEMGDLEFAKAHNELAIYLPAQFDFDYLSIYPNLNNISQFFERIYGGSQGDHRVLYDLWYANEAFAGGISDLPNYFFFISKNPMNEKDLNSYRKDLDGSQTYRKKIFTPSISEVALTELVYYSIHQRAFFPTPVLTRTKTKTGEKVYLGGFNAKGLVIGSGENPQAKLYTIR